MRRNGIFISTLAFLSFTVHAEYVSKTYPTEFATGLVRTAKSREFLLNAPRASFSKMNAAVPGKYSLRGKAGPVEEQGNCGSCWDFSLTTNLRGTLKMAGKDPGRLSFNYLLNCSNQWGCMGGDFSAADYFIQPQGAPNYGDDGVYTASSSDCFQGAPIAASAISYKLIGANFARNSSAPQPSFKDIAYAIGVLHQPVSVDVNADQTWRSYVSGVYDGCTGDSASDLNHMVVAEGYDCETAVDANGNCVFNKDGNLPAGVGTWLIRNSWGKKWGDAGYITTKATDSEGRLCNAIATDALYFEVK